MRLRTKLDERQIRNALAMAKTYGLVHESVTFQELAAKRATGGLNGFEVKIGSQDHRVLEGAVNQHDRPQKTRRRSATGYYWAALYDEWGWFIREIYRRDPEAVVGPYKNEDSFHELTKNRYEEDYSE